MRVLFVTPQPGHTQPFGVMVLSAVLKQAGHVVGLVALNQLRIERALRKDKWDILAFSISTASYAEAISICRNVRRKIKIYTIFGGSHATFSPEIIEEESIDAICRGEGEFALIEFLEKMQNGKSITNVENWWVKENGNIFRNDVRPLIDDLDSLPFADREIAREFNFFTPGLQEVLISRGCLFNCSYCFNETYAKLYSSKGKRIRSRSLENVFEELKQIKSKYLVSNLAIFDDLFPINEEWNQEFCERYRHEIDIPFSVESRPGYLTERMVKDLKKAGCSYILLGIETANEKLRYGILNRQVKNDVIEDCCQMINSNGIGIAAFLLCGIPNSTIQDDLMTLQYARKLKVDVPLVNACQPYPKTRMFEEAVKNGLLDPNYRITPSDLLNCRRSPFNFPSKLQNRMVYNIVCLYPVFISNKINIKFLEFLIKLPLGPIYFFILKYWLGMLRYVRGDRKNKILLADISKIIKYMLTTY